MKTALIIVSIITGFLLVAVVILIHDVVKIWQAIIKINNWIAEVEEMSQGKDVVGFWHEDIEG
jgi:hypothetical protein